MDRKTEEAVSLAQKSGRSDLIPSWCKAPEDLSPPETVPSPSPSEAAPPPRPFRPKQVHPRGEKRIRRKHTHNSPWGPDRGLGTVVAEAGVVVGAPGEKQTPTPPQNSPWGPPLHVIQIVTGFQGLYQSVTKEDPTGEGWLFSLTDRMDAIGPSKFKLLEGWADLNDQEFDLVITDALAVAGIETSSRGLDDCSTTEEEEEDCPYSS